MANVLFSDQTPVTLLTIGCCHCCLQCRLPACGPPTRLPCLLSPSLSEIVLGKSHQRSQHSPFVRLLKSIMKSGRCFWSHTDRHCSCQPLSRNWRLLEVEAPTRLPLLFETIFRPPNSEQTQHNYWCSIWTPMQTFADEIKGLEFKRHGDKK